MTDIDTSRPLVEIRGLRKNYWKEDHDIKVLRGIDLDIYQGERISIIGESGSGKSTFLHVLGTLDVPTDGKILFQGADVFRRPPAKLAEFRNHTIGFVFQFHHLLPEFTAMENVAMPALIQRMAKSEAEDRASSILRDVGLEKRFDHRPGELSGGEQQRVAIARALVLSPQLLLADEPTGNLDERNAEQIHNMLDRINESQGLTIVLVTHSSSLAKRMPRQLEMKEGRLHSLSEAPPPGATSEGAVEGTVEAQGA